MKITDRWRQLLDQRLHEAITILGQTPGVQGLIVGGSVGRGEPWPMSDIDLLPIYSNPDAASELDQKRAELVDWWAASGRAQTLDVGRLAFTTIEISEAIEAGPEYAIARMNDPRWFHGLDKAYGGHAANSDNELGTAFATWATTIRFHSAIMEARIAAWQRQAIDAMTEAIHAQPDDPAKATCLVRESARALRMVLIERWGHRLGSMGREWTRFERMAHQHGQEPLAARIATIAGADTATTAQRRKLAPIWLLERIELCYAARTAVGENVSMAENARDQIAAFSVHVSRRRPDLIGPWTAIPDPNLNKHLSDLNDLVTQLC
jgi:predicted nucleotidyltransferase